MSSNALTVFDEPSDDMPTSDRGICRVGMAFVLVTFGVFGTWASINKIRANQNEQSSAKQSSIAAQKAFTHGVVNAVDVLTAAQNELKARRDLLKAQYEFMTSLFILNRWVGRASEESVNSVNVWLGGKGSGAVEDLKVSEKPKG